MQARIIITTRKKGWMKKFADSSDLRYNPTQRDANKQHKADAAAINIFLSIFADHSEEILFADDIHAESLRFCELTACFRACKDI